MIDFLFLAALAAVTWCVAAEGAWGAGIVFLSSLFAGLIAMNFFEPLAATLQESVPGGAAYWDFVALVGLFTALVFGFRAAAEYLMPTYVEVHALAHNILRWLLAAATGYVVVAVLMTSLHTAPLPRSFAGFHSAPGSKMFFGLGPDIQWLALTQYVSERSLSSGRPFDAVAAERIAGEPATVTTFSSFPIRYAMRRGQPGAGGFMSGSSSSAPSSGAPPPTTTPGGRRTNAF
jgi:hypothetical protein